MPGRWIGAALALGFSIGTVGSLSAQQPQSAPGQPSISQQEAPPARPAGRTRAAAPALQTDPDFDAADQLAPSQVAQPLPAAVAQPSGVPARMRAHGATAAPRTHNDPPWRPSRSARAHVVDCNGPFGRNSNHLRLAMTFDTRNVAYTEVDAGNGNKVMASVLFGKDPKTRLEVWWSKPATRSDTYLILINGKSSWLGPHGLHLGLGLPALEKLNKRPFKLKGFDKNQIAAVSDWGAGALAAIPGGCRAGVNLRPDPRKTSADALSAFPADHEYSSADPAMRALNPMVSEILVGY